MRPDSLVWKITLSNVFAAMLEKNEFL